MATYVRPRAVAPGWMAVTSDCFSAVRVVGSPRAGTVTLLVEFRESGSRWAYRVDQPTVADFLGAGSLGQFYNDRIKGTYVGRRV